MKKILPAVFCLALLCTSCAKQMDDEPKQSDSTSVADSLLHLHLDSISKERLIGTWVRPIATQPGDEGYHLYGDGKLKLINMYSMIGDTWELRGDTLMLYAHTEKYPTPVPMIFRINALGDSTLELVPENAAPGYTETYRRKNFTMPERFAKTFGASFNGTLDARGTNIHTVNVDSYFDGIIGLTSQNPKIVFSVSKDGKLLTETGIRLLKGGFPPGKYTITITQNGARKAKGVMNSYIITMKEEEIEK